MFDSSAMLELAHIKADRYQRNGGGGAHKVYASSKAYYDARGHNELAPWPRILAETKIRWEQSKQLAREQFRIACLTSREGFYHGTDIPF
jgi:hypothetical protein